ncbi:MAG TPA: nicotinate-nucleotide adenylyltransferase [Bacillota bacterium]
MGYFGIMGGTFDPIHLGHLILAEKAGEVSSLEKIIFVPAAIPPHKIGEVLTPAEHRLRMVELAIEGHPGFEISRVELDREGPSYTADTIRQLIAIERGAEAVLILGFDSLLELYTWKNYRDILDQARIITAFRPGSPVLRDANDWPLFLQPYRERITILEAPLLDISSTWLRVELMQGRSIRYLVPDAVREYIRENRLYEPRSGSTYSFFEKAQ